MPRPDASWGLNDVIAHVDGIRRSPAARAGLVELLAERAPVYAGRGTNEVERIRSCLLASFAATGLPAAAIPYVVEELESGRNPHTVAAAARAVRGGGTLPPDIVPLLLAAAERFAAADDRVSLDTASSPPHAGRPTTVLTEIFCTLGWLGPLAARARDALQAMLRQPTGAFSRAVREEIAGAIEAISTPAAGGAGACCARADACEAEISGPGTGSFPDSLSKLLLQDQDGAHLTLAEALLGRASAVAFFYTRCMNPERCSLTITKLAGLQSHLFQEELHDEVNVAGITYDPRFDLPARLRTYGADRGMRFDPRNRLLRTIGSFEPLRAWFDLGVGYGPVTVNRHRLDLVLLDAAGRVAASYQRRLWPEDEVLCALRRIARRQVPDPAEATGRTW